MVLWVHEFKPSEKNVMVNIDDIRNLDQSPRLVFIDEKCGNLIVVNDGGELINQKNSDVLQIAYRCPLSDKCRRREYFFSNPVEYLL